MRRYNIETIKAKVLGISDGKYECISNYYKNCYTKLTFLCNEGHKYEATWTAFQQGSRCPKCRWLIPIKFIKEHANKFGYSCLSDEYLDSKSKLNFKCDNEHLFRMSWNNFQQGQRCRKCWEEFNKGKNSYLWKGGVTEKEIPLFDTYASQIDFCEEVRRDSENLDFLQVKCTESSCRKWFRPNRKEISKRIDVLNGRMGGESRLYCSDECKKNCSTFGQHFYPKGFKQDYSRPNQQEWAELVKERDNYTCQKCGSKENLEAHHIEGIYENPLMSADIDLGVTLCKQCHKEAHKDEGCKYVDMRNKCV